MPKKRVRVEEYPHAYLVIGTGSIDAARKALFLHLDKKKWTRIMRMPVRPLHDTESGCCVAMYFAAGPGGEQVYKP
jgi:hypothetical protein